MFDCPKRLILRLDALCVSCIFFYHAIMSPMTVNNVTTTVCHIPDGHSNSDFLPQKTEPQSGFVEVSKGVYLNQPEVWSGNGGRISGHKA